MFKKIGNIEQCIFVTRFAAGKIRLDPFASKEFITDVFSLMACNLEEIDKKLQEIRRAAEKDGYTTILKILKEKMEFIE